MKESPVEQAFRIVFGNPPRRKVILGGHTFPTRCLRFDPLPKSRTTCMRCGRMEAAHV